MPIIKSAIKRARQQETRRSRNLQIKRAVHQDTRTVLDALAVGDTAAITASLREAQSEIDRAVKKGALHKNTAARRKSRLVRQVAAVLKAEPKPKAAAKPKSTTAKAKAPTKKPATKKPAAKKPSAKKTSE
jgi:small subunit ribosomal protein S20